MEPTHEEPPTKRGLAWLIATVFGSGHAPIAPGSVGALFALPAAYALRGAPLLWWALAIAVVTAGGTYATHRYLAKPDDDPHEVVVDELAGCLITLAFVPWDPLWALGAYAVFRFLDIAKPWPISVLDREVGGAIGVMADDVAAGLIGGAALYGLHAWLA